jgi:hypothetical protein
MYLSLLGETFTWSSNKDLRSESRIDRFLVPPDREAQFHSVIEKAT